MAADRAADAARSTLGSTWRWSGCAAPSGGWCPRASSRRDCWTARRAQPGDDRLIRRVAGIKVAAPDHTLQHIAAQLEAMRERAHTARWNKVAPLLRQAPARSSGKARASRCPAGTGRSRGLAIRRTRPIGHSCDDRAYAKGQLTQKRPRRGSSVPLPRSHRPSPIRRPFPRPLLPTSRGLPRPKSG
jgi:hypothetical protein